MVTHFDMFSRSLRALSKSLRQNMYKLCHPSFPIDEIMAPAPDLLADVRYSSIYWIDHLTETVNLSEIVTASGEEMALSDGGTILSFFEEHFLHWLESLALLRKLADGLLSIRKLLHLLQVCLRYLRLSFEILTIISHNPRRVSSLLSS